ncbi:MAG: putative Macrolide-specific efflux protein macA precursor [Verrucomicrobiales bacterium]|nr:putative Macrolide-specific efflux protein macA precursor [Verrucomicrobiales bacterium]
MKKSLVFTLLDLAGVILCVALVSCGKKVEQGGPKPALEGVPVTVTVAKTMMLDRTLPIVGTLFAKDEATVAAQVEGQLEKTTVDFGDRLTNGQEIALIDTTSYEAQEQQAGANVSRAKASALNAEQNLKRMQALQKEKISAESELEKAVAESEQARAEVKAAEAAAVIARLNLERSHVRAPFDSAVAERIGSAGDFVKLGAPLFRVVNDGVLKYIVQAPEAYAGHVAKEQLVTFTVDAFPTNTFEGKVFLISPQVNTATRAFGLGALVKNTDRKLRANTFARGELVIEKNVPTVVVPIEAILNFAGITKVFVVDENVVHSHDVEAGRIKDGVQEILSGLDVGQTVVLSGQSKLYEGAKIRIKGDEAKQASAKP